LFNPQLLAGIKRVIPQSLIDRLDPFEAEIRRFVQKTAKATRAGARVLDAGAGECRFKPAFAHARYVGVDFGLGDANWDYSKLDAVGRLEQLPFPDASFDRVLSIVVLEHTPEPAQVIQEFQRVLSPGGTVHLVVPHMWEEHQKPHDYFRYTSNGMRHLMEKAGLTVDRIEPVGGFFWMLGRRTMNVLSFTQRGWRWIFFPFLAPVFGLILPLCCYYLDYLDSDRAYTLGFVCEGSKPIPK
jgi:ubiquinone/menaquinone biosynthesis C-methylase UbiE